jgi:hypothetical protein
MQTSLSNIHMFCLIQTYKHSHTSGIKIHINHIIHYHRGMHVFHTFSSYLSADGTSTQTILLLDADGTSTQWVLDMMPKGLQPKRS